MWCHMFYFTVTCYTESNAVVVHYLSVNSSLPEQNGRRFADEIFKYTFLNKKCGIFIRVSSKFVAKGPIDNTSVLVRVMALHRTGDKSLPEPMLTISPSHICGIMEKWVKTGSRVPLGWYIRVCLHVWVSKCRCMRLCSIPMLYD